VSQLKISAGILLVPRAIICSLDCLALDGSQQQFQFPMVLEKEKGNKTVKK
jgi:hypothetical protein